MILIRVTPTEKEEIKAVAEALDMSVAEYVLSLHRHVRDRV